MKIRFTNLGKVFAGIALFFYLAAMTSQSMLLLALLGVIAGLFIVNYVAGSKMLKGVELHPPQRALIPEGGKLEQPWQVVNNGKTAVQMVWVHSAGERLFGIEKLEPGDEAFKVPDVRLLRRGVYPHKEVQLATLYPFGLLAVKRDLPLKGVTLVHPKIYPAKAPAAAGFEATTGGRFKGTRRSAFGANFAGVRPWVTGDPVKQVHWKSSAKGKGLMVKTFEEELSGKISLLVHLHAKATREAVDSALRCAGSLMFAALDEGHQLEWAITGQGKVCKVPPFSDGGEILEALACAEAGASASTSSNLERLGEQLSRRSALALVATNADPSWLGWLQQQGHSRKLTVYLPEGTSTEQCNFDTIFYGTHEISGSAATPAVRGQSAFMA